MPQPTSQTSGTRRRHSMAGIKDRIAKRRLIQSSPADGQASAPIRETASDTFGARPFYGYTETKESKEARQRNENARRIVGKSTQAVADQEDRLGRVVPAQEEEKATEQPVAEPIPVEQTPVASSPSVPKQTAVSTPALNSAEPTIETPKVEGVLAPEQKAETIDAVANEVNTDLTSKGKEEVAKEAQRLTYDQMIQQANRFKERKDADEAKRLRRQAIFSAIGDGVAALSNLYFTSKGAPSVQYDPNASLSARALALEAKRDAEKEKAYLNARNEEKDAIAEARQRRQEERQDRLDKENKEYRDKTLAQQEQYRKDQLALQKYNAELNAQVKREQFVAQAEREAAKQNAITYRTLYKGGSGSSGTTPLYLGDGEVINLPSKALSEQKNISAIYNALPLAYKEAAFEKFNLGKYSDKKQLTPTQMNQIIGEYIEMDDAEEARKILRSLAGGTATTSNKQSGLGWGKGGNTNETDW